MTFTARHLTRRRAGADAEAQQVCALITATCGQGGQQSSPVKGTATGPVPPPPQGTPPAPPAPQAAAAAPGGVMAVGGRVPGAAGASKATPSHTPAHKVGRGERL